MDGAFQTIATLLEELFGHVDSDGDGALDEEDDLCCRGSDMVPSVMGALLFHFLSCSVHTLSPMLCSHFRHLCSYQRQRR